MDYSPHTEADVGAMLATIGAASVGELFDAIPASVRLEGRLEVPGALSEPELVRHLAELAGRTAGADGHICFSGGGAYDHHVPAAVTALASRAEFATSYTPYQAELSQGVLQALYEFQTLVCEVYGLEVANASLYDGANSLVEAVTLAVRHTGRHRVVIASTVHPHWRQVLKTYTSGLGLDITTVPYGEDGGAVWEKATAEGAAAVVASYPNFFGRLEDVRTVVELAHGDGALAVIVADPTAMGILEPPGALGADVAVGEGQALGSPLFYGGPYIGLFATREALVRQVPGRIAGESTDADGRRAFVLTLQAREQHIRRARATSNVCTNQTLVAIAAAIHVSWLGPKGLATLGEACARRAAYAAERLAEIPGCRTRFPGPHFKEFVLETPVDARELVRRLPHRGFLAGPALAPLYPGQERCLLVAVTERRTQDDVDGLAEAIYKELAEL